jgi:phosphotransferase system  glucose/maltose/N-acetylglucosamine-specific IIC component
MAIMVNVRLRCGLAWLGSSSESINGAGFLDKVGVQGQVAAIVATVVSAIVTTVVASVVASVVAAIVAAVVSAIVTTVVTTVVATPVLTKLGLSNTSCKQHGQQCCEAHDDRLT